MKPQVLIKIFFCNVLALICCLFSQYYLYGQDTPSSQAITEKPVSNAFRRWACIAGIMHGMPAEPKIIDDSLPVPQTYERICKFDNKLLCLEINSNGNIKYFQNKEFKKVKIDQPTKTKEQITEKACAYLPYFIVSGINHLRLKDAIYRKEYGIWEVVWERYSKSDIVADEGYGIWVQDSNGLPVRALGLVTNASPPDHKAKLTEAEAIEIGRKYAQSLVPQKIPNQPDRWKHYKAVRHKRWCHFWLMHPPLMKSLNPKEASENSYTQDNNLAEETIDNHRLKWIYSIQFNYDFGIMGIEYSSLFAEIIYIDAVTGEIYEQPQKHDLGKKNE